MTRPGVFLLELMVGLTAVFAGTSMVAEPVNGGPLSLEASWLDGSPFSSYLVPGLFLAGVIGTGMMAASYSQLMRLKYAPHISLLCGLVLDVWIGVQVTIIPFSPMQVVILIAGTAIAVLAIFQIKMATREARRFAGGRSVHAAG